MFPANCKALPCHLRRLALSARPAQPPKMIFGRKFRLFPNRFLGARGPQKHTHVVLAGSSLTARIAVVVRSSLCAGLHFRLCAGRCERECGIGLSFLLRITILRIARAVVSLGGGSQCLPCRLRLALGRTCFYYRFINSGLCPAANATSPVRGII